MATIEMPVITAEATTITATPVVATVGLYTSLTEVESIFSYLGVHLRLDDNIDEIKNPNELGYLQDIFEEVTDRINIMLGPYYTAYELASSRWIRRRASWLACCILARRRGNAPQFSAECEQAMADLVYLKTHVSAWGPRMSNQRVDYRYRGSQLRTDPVTSTDGGVSQFKDWRYPWLQGW